VTDGMDEGSAKAVVSTIARHYPYLLGERQ